MTAFGGMEEERERGFVLDCNTVRMIPQYSAAADKHAGSFLNSRIVGERFKDKCLVKELGSQGGPLVDRAIRSSPVTKYIEMRNRMGAGYSEEVVAGHMSLKKFGRSDPDSHLHRTLSRELTAEGIVWDSYASKSLQPEMSTQSSSGTK